MSTSAPSQWYKGQFLISTSQALLDHEIINKAFEADYMYWTKRLSDDAMKKMLSHSLCFGVYSLPESSSEIAGRALPTQIGLGRVITDESSFAYLTDVFIIPEYQGKGLGRWLMQCIKETFDSWPDFRAAMLFTGGHDGERAIKFYEQIFGMKVFVPGVNGLQIMVSRGPGSTFKNS